MSALYVPSDYFKRVDVRTEYAEPEWPLEVDLGCGDGTFLVEMAKHFPQRNFLGVERMKGRVLKTLRKIEAAGLTNVKVMRLESAYAVGWLFEERTVERVHLLCPDPWPKKKHFKNRLYHQVEFREGLKKILMVGGEFLLKTDHLDYHLQGLEVMERERVFLKKEWDELAYYPQTDFEKHWLSQGLEMYTGRWQLIS
jgi:tRNA (guanine-N7-)-methyltransferase